MVASVMASMRGVLDGFMTDPDFNGRSDEFFSRRSLIRGRGGNCFCAARGWIRAVNVGQDCSPEAASYFSNYEDRSADSFYVAGLVSVDRFADGRKEVLLSYAVE